jgi:hypothetical protein
MSPMNEEEIYNLARQRVKARREFFSNLAAYFIINAFLVGIWYFTGNQGYFWPGWVMGGWGIGLALHAVRVFAIRPESDKSAVEKEAEKIRKGQ